MDILEELKIKFKTGDVLTRLLFINCGMYVILLFLDISFILLLILVVCILFISLLSFQLLLFRLRH